MDDDAKRRLHSNPLRILDSKNPAMQDLIETAPKLRDVLGDSSRAVFEAVQNGVRQAGIEYRVNPRLVRGLDYYNSTVYEWVIRSLFSRNMFSRSNAPARRAVPSGAQTPLKKGCARQTA